MNSLNRLSAVSGIFLFSLLLSVPSSAFAEPVTSVKFRGACAKALGSKNGRIYQSKPIKDWASCRAEIAVRDSRTKKGIPGQLVRIFKNVGARPTNTLGCYDLFSGTATTDKKGKAKISFPWENGTCGLAVKNTSNGEGGPATALVDVSKFSVCNMETSAVRPGEICSGTDYSGYYMFSTSDPGYTAGCGGNRIIGVDVRKSDSGFKIQVANGPELRVESVTNEMLRASYADPAGRFTRRYVLEIRVGSSPKQADVRFDYEFSNNLNDPLSTPSCNDSFRGTANRSPVEPADYSGTYRFSPTVPSSGIAPWCQPQTVTVKVQKLAANIYSVILNGATTLPVSQLNAESLDAGYDYSTVRYRSKRAFHVEPSTSQQAQVEFELIENNNLSSPLDRSSCSFFYSGLAAKTAE